MKHFELRLTADALRDLNEIYSYIAEHRSEADADHVLNRILDATNDTTKFPNRGAITPELAALDIRAYREVFFKPYRIIYRVVDDRVYVFVIADGRRDFGSLLSQRHLR